MRYSIFDDAKAAVSMAAVALAYGFKPNRAGYICCPFHQEKTPSLKLYDKSFYCFGCGAHGSAIDFVSMLYNLDSLGAVKRLNEDLHLGLSIDHPPNCDEIQKRARIAKTRELFTKWREGIVKQLDAVFRIAELADYTKLSEAEITAIKYKEAVECWADTLVHGTLEKQMEIFRDREGVERLCKMILKGMQTKSIVA